MPCGPPKPRKAVLETVLVLSGSERSCDRGQPVAVVGVEQARSVDRAGEIGRPAAAGGEDHVEALDPALAVEADLVVDDEIVALAGDDHVVVAVGPDLGGAAGLLGDQRATQANRLPCVSLPPKPPPMRRTSTVTACEATPSTLATMCWISVGCWVEE